MNTGDPGNGGLRAAPPIAAESVPAPERKRGNPLSELIGTEARYVSELSIAIRRAAAAWSQANFPPPQLDRLFRAIELIYRTNNEFLRSLQEIGPTPSSPKGLGNLLMAWIDKLDEPYTRYCHVYMVDMDRWAPIQYNPDLPRILAAASQELPRVDASDPVHPHDTGAPWTMDAFFRLPIARLRFYKKLYSRLLRSTQPGRSDYDLLRTANEKLDALLELAHRQESVSVLASNAAEPSSARGAAGAGATVDAGAARGAGGAEGAEGRTAAPSTDARAPSSTTPPVGAAAQGAPLPAGKGPAPLGAAAALPPPPPTETGAPGPESRVAALSASLAAQSVDQIQARISSAYTMDIFSMQPKSCRLQINPPSLPFYRTLRVTDGFPMHVNPPNAHDRRVLQYGRIIVLTDLVLIGEDVLKDTENRGEPRQDIWLMFPPLAGKFVEAVPSGNANEHALRILIMGKAEIIVYLPSAERQHAWLRAIDACHQFAAQRTPRAAPAAGGAAAPGGGGAGAPSAAAPPAVAPSAAAPPAVAPSAAAPPAVAPSAAAPPAVAPSAAAPPAVAPSAAAPSAAAPAVAPPASASMGGGAAAYAALGAPARAEGSGIGAPLPDSAHAARSQPRQAMSPPPLLIPGATTVEPLPPVPIGEQDAGPLSPTTPSAHLTRENSLTSLESFAKAPLRNRIGSPESRGPSPLSMARQPTSPTRSAFPSLGMRSAPGSDEGGVSGPGSTDARVVPVRQATAPSPLVPQPGRTPGGVPSGTLALGSDAGVPGARTTPAAAAFLNARRPSEPNMDTSLQVRAAPAPSLPPGHRAPIRSASQPRLQGGVGSAMSPSQMLQGGARDMSPDWMDMPQSNAAEAALKKPTSFDLCAQMRCKVFLKQSYAQWKALGHARLRLYHLQPTRANQLVVENNKKLLISSIVLSDAIERVGKTGVAVELSDAGRPTGVVYMLHLRSEESASGLFHQLIEGSGRTTSPKLVAGAGGSGGG
ncbi:hypothetical protein MSPP1_003196 [Malassezia sp. CBS 17886]|nr:hypothetical protein MSPP1_003196 [Malassezia sp. CBS 17886]